jgi:hypothetical protein
MRPSIALALLAGVAGAGSAWIGRAPAAPPASAVEIYSRECGACHLAYPAQLLPGRSWQALLDGLARHFGENATLDPEAARSIAGYLAANAAAPGSPALEGLGPADLPLRITGTPYWKELHQGIAPARFAAPRVKSPSNCLGCHNGGHTEG